MYDFAVAGTVTCHPPVQEFSNYCLGTLDIEGQPNANKIGLDAAQQVLRSDGIETRNWPDDVAGYSGAERGHPGYGPAQHQAVMDKPFDLNNLTVVAKSEPDTDSSPLRS